MPTVRERVDRVWRAEVRAAAMPSRTAVGAAEWIAIALILGVAAWLRLRDLHHVEFSGDQVHIPVWADRFYLGWFFRSVAEPKRYVPRYWGAVKLLPLMLRHRDRLPDLKP